MDECARGVDFCHENATCNNTEGSYTCICDSGYTGNGLCCTSKFYFPTISDTADTIYTVHIIIQMLMSALATMEVATTTVKIQMEVILVPVIMATSLTVMDTNVMVNRHL